MLPILDITLDQLENFMGVQIQQIAGPYIWELALIYMIIIFYIMIKMQVGMEAGVIIGFFTIFMLTRGFGGQGGIIGDAVFMGAVVVIGFIIYLWMKRDIL